MTIRGEDAPLLLPLLFFGLLLAVVDVSSLSADLLLLLPPVLLSSPDGRGFGLCFSSRVPDESCCCRARASSYDLPSFPRLRMETRS